jgi:hypothetical protein
VWLQHSLAGPASRTCRTLQGSSSPRKSSPVCLSVLEASSLGWEAGGQCVFHVQYAWANYESAVWILLYLGRNPECRRRLLYSPGLESGLADPEARSSKP